MTETTSPIEPARFDPTVPNVARMYDYYLGGKDNFASDREAAERALGVAPELRTGAREVRRFVHRVVRHLVRAGIRQFIDVGCGLPTQGNVHEVAQAAAPDVRVAYVDNDPVVIAHARALLEPNPLTVVVNADVRDPDAILADPGLLRLIDLSQPVAVLMVALLHVIPDDELVHSIVTRFRDAMAPGSYLAIAEAVADLRPETTAKLAALYQQRTTVQGPYRSTCGARPTWNRTSRGWYWSNPAWSSSRTGGPTPHSPQRTVPRTPGRSAASPARPDLSTSAPTPRPPGPTPPDPNPGRTPYPRAEPGLALVDVLMHPLWMELQTIPGPLRNRQTGGHIVGRRVVARHRRRRPDEVVVQHLAERFGGEPGIVEGLVETGDRAVVHLLMRSVSAVQPHHRGLVCVRVGVRGGTAQRLRPVGREPLGVIGFESVTERMADHLVGHHPEVPGLRQPEQTVITAGRRVHSLHAYSMSGAAACSSPGPSYPTDILSGQCRRVHRQP